jgi:hypothetical protein
LWVKRRHVKGRRKVGTVLKFNSYKAGRLIAALAATLVFGLVGAGSALADDSASLPAYGGPGGSEQGTVDQITAPATEAPGQAVLGEKESGGSAPATQPSTGGNEVLGVRAGGGKLPSTAKAPAAASAPSTASAPASSKASHRLVGSLPFTGLDLIMVALVGIALLALGFGLRRMTSTPQVG